MSSNEERSKTITEWIVSICSLFLVLGVVVFMVYDYITYGDQPPIISVKPQLKTIKQIKSDYYLPVKVTNRGNIVARDVWIKVILFSNNKEIESAQFIIDYFPGKEEYEQTLIFHNNPAKNSLKYSASFHTR